MWKDVKTVRRKPRHSQTQGSVERANQDIQNVLTAWMNNNETNKWLDGLCFESEYSETHLQNILLLKENDISLDKSYTKESQVTISNSTSLKSLQEADSGVVDVENSIEVIGSEEKPVCFEESKQINKCDCMDCMRKLDEEQKRISHIINLDAADNSKSKDLEVIHTKIVRRCKVAAKMDDNKSVAFEKCVTNNDETENTNTLQLMSDSQIKNYNCVSNISTDSGLSIDKSTPNCDVSDSLLFNVNTFQPGLDFKFSIPDTEEKEFNQDNNWWAERKEPEGQEDPSPNVDCLQKQTAVLKSPDKDTVLTDDEVSIYDLNKYCDNEDSSSSYYKNEKTECNISFDMAKVQDDDSDSTEDNISSCTLHSDESDHEKLLNVIEKSDDSLRLSENMLLYLSLEIFELVEEKFYKMFPAFTGYLEGTPEIIFIVLSDKYLYFLRRGNREERLHKEASFVFSEIDYIYVGINYQEFLIVSTDRKRVYQIYTGNHNLTRSIISHLEVAIRRTKQPKLPCVFVDATAHKIYLKKFIAQNLNCGIMTVQLYHYALVHWENYIGHNSLVFSTPAGPHYQGFLMYRFHKNTADSNEPWEAGYFMLKNGVLFCFNSKSEKDVKFYVQLCVPHCKGCRRLPYADRPHVFELIVSKEDSLQLAAADDYDASVWLQSFLQAVCQAGHFFDPEPTYQTCCIVLANDSILTLQGKNYKQMHELLGCANICDLLHAYVEDDASLCCILEFESGEADRCSGEWILFFGCSDERERFLNVLFYKWEEIYKRKLPVSPIKDLSLLEKCKEMSHKLTKERLLSHCIFEELD
ncbi:uncharacterized protein LOC111637101 [Centruroides sculpturatus]|uniref:uncharacterized protein LOC111637101 n=1 Tax=Centruroides sculpturatus TaxID=218467 RepID=UPI000C6E62EA|nr:uncharacterized protein LOC111637101 [Centruroides sculpturatus]